MTEGGKNIIIGIMIVLLYWGGFYIANYVEPTNNYKHNDFRILIYGVIMCLGITYEKSNKLLISIFESVFISIIINDSLSLYFFGERTYDIKDLIIIPILIIIESAKRYKDHFREYSIFCSRGIYMLSTLFKKKKKK